MTDPEIPAAVTAELQAEAMQLEEGEELTKTAHEIESGDMGAGSE